MQRITEKMLEQKVEYLNKVTNNPPSPYGDNVANVGNYHISYAYRGVALHQISNTGGGVRDVFMAGYTPKRELYNRICAFIMGIDQ